jgi:RNA polymerase sigma-70 factor (ECF subfamily)
MIGNRSNTTASDAAVVALVLAGKREAYATLVSRHQQTLYRHARGMGLDHDTSLDLVQDAFVKAYQRLSECRKAEHFRAWILRINRNLCYDHVRNVRSATLPMSSVPSQAIHTHIEQPDVELTATLRQALFSLPIVMREAFLLKHQAGYSYDEVAEITESTPSAVKMRVHRAREALREFLVHRGVYAA